MSKLTVLEDIIAKWTKADKEAQEEAVKRLGLPKNNTAKDRAKAMGLFGAAFGLGFIIGPAIGGILAGSDPNNPNVLLPPIIAAALSFIALIVALISLKVTNLSVNGFEKKRLKSLKSFQI